MYLQLELKLGVCHAEMPVNFIWDKIKFNKLVNRISLYISVFIPQHFSLEQLDPGNVMLINHIPNTGIWLDKI